jgi:hypothetical protein
MGMKKFLILLMLMASPLVAVAQLQYISDRAVATNPFTGGMVPLSYAQVRVCNTTTSIAAPPCSNIAQIYDVNGNAYPTSLGSNFGQLVTDSMGRFTFACNTGNYNIQIQASGNNTPSMNYILSCPGNTSYIATPNTWTGVNTFTQPIVGDINSSGASTFNALTTTGTVNIGTATGTVNIGNINSLGSAYMTGTFSYYNGHATAGVGIPSVMAVSDYTLQTADLPLTTVFTPSTTGMYRVVIYISETVVATTSSTLPATYLQWTDGDSNFTNTLGQTNSDTLNTQAAIHYATATIYAAAGQPIKVSTSGYASSGTTSMKFALHVRVERF